MVTENSRALLLLRLCDFGAGDRVEFYLSICYPKTFRRNLILMAFRHTEVCQANGTLVLIGSLHTSNSYLRHVVIVWNE